MNLSGYLQNIFAEEENINLTYTFVIASLLKATFKDNYCISYNVIFNYIYLFTWIRKKSKRFQIRIVTICL